MMQNKNILLLNSQSVGMGEVSVQHNFSELDMYDFPQANLDSKIALIIQGSVDQELMLKNKEKIRKFADSGKVIVFGGHLFLPWLPGASFFVPKEVRSHKDYDISIINSHPIFEGVDTYDMTYNKGVAGFFARGHHPIPEGAEVLLTLPDHEPIVYIDRVSTDGTLLVSSGNALLNYQDPNRTTGQITSRLVEWIHNEYAQLQKRSVVQ
ncbi:phosphate starvation-inducible protein PhoH [Paenibacillus sp. FSL H8-0548]|uniref:phosphate starvation-inducible protein PhoH n=1 Tax=Paenibacillus sp. FSL H8-0548 TaxID=1920422 RepID=UPI00096F2CE4|nr:phosphate starvation-inducible protein PhoH [Paenibacillus sp. FSL H8-0548]OMF37588.1 phosphate starvation-inducible protein PhoH [Paenibacillus sp. FSL H8-0548]